MSEPLLNQTVDQTADQDKITVPPWQCDICVSSESDPVILNCTHSFCNNCVRKIRTTNNQCPICKSIISSVTLNAALAPYTKKQEISYNDNTDIVKQIQPPEIIYEQPNINPINQQPNNFLQKFLSHRPRKICYYVIWVINLFSLCAMNGLWFFDQSSDLRNCITGVIENTVIFVTAVTFWVLGDHESFSVTDKIIRGVIVFCVFYTILLFVPSGIIGEILYKFSDDINIDAYFYSNVVIWIGTIVIIEIPIIITLISEIYNKTSLCSCSYCGEYVLIF